MHHLIIDSYEADESSTADETIEHAYGDVRLFRDSNASSRSLVVAVVAVPSYMSATDFLGFVRNSISKVSHFRMIRKKEINRYMVLMKFRDKRSAQTFRDTYNGLPFNSIEPERCHVLYVKSIQINQSTLPYAKEDDPFITQIPEGSTSKPAPPPQPNLNELPTCPVCLERMDASITGLLTILCQHTFHCQCLSSWADNSCPVCRHRHSERPTESFCSDCGAKSNLWTCLICGNLGCGRYANRHAIEHFQRTNHVYSMEIDTQRIWDYASDGYVHRLLQNRADGKLMELSGTHTLSNDKHSPFDDEYVDEKLDDVALEYAHMLSSQLESQRMYFEDKIIVAADKASAASSRAEAAEKHRNLAETKSKEYKEQLDILSKNLKQSQTLLKESENENSQITKRLAQYKKDAGKLLREHNDESSMGTALSGKLKRVEEDNLKKDKQIKDLEEQLQDLMFTLTASNMIKNNVELQGGDVGMSAKTKPRKTRR